MKHEHPSLTTLDGQEVVLRRVHAEGRLEGLLLTMRLRQVFCNDGPTNLEVTYTFPLAFGAVLTGLEVTLGGKRMTGRVMARRDARERYEDAIAQGDAPVMVEKGESGVFSAMLGSLQPGEEAVVELQYAQLLAFEQGRLRLVIPTTIAPRYGDAVRQSALQPEQVPQASLLAEHRFGLKLTLAGEVAQARISCPTHTTASHSQGDDLVLELPGVAWLDRDFVLLLDGLQGRSFALVGPDEHSGEGHVALIASCCPALPESAALPLRLKILVDCSGSMAGDSMVQARAALKRLLGTLAPTDHVSLSRFGNRPQRVLGAAAATASHLQALERAIDQTDADLGGTEIADALEDTFALSMQGSGGAQEADVLLITDGEVWGARQIVNLAVHMGHRIYALGVGAAPAESLLREMAEASGGVCEFVTPSQDMALAVDRLVQRIRSTQAVQARLPLDAPSLWSSPMPRRLRSGETFHIHTRLARMPSVQALVLEGVVTAPAQWLRRADDLVARLVAARQADAEQDIQATQALAEKYQLVTEHTNLLLVVERAQHDKTDGMPALHQVSPMVAAGWAGSGSLMQHQRQHAQMLQVRSGASSYDSLSVGAVWRNNRTQSAAKIDALGSGGMDDFEIPAFLRKQEEQPRASVEAREKKSLLRRLWVRDKAAASTAMPETLLSTFNAAASLGQGFRQTLRAVTDLSHEVRLLQLILKVGNEVGGPVKAWACYLWWLLEREQGRPVLSAQALALLDEQMATIPLQHREKALGLFEGAGLSAQSTEVA